MAATPAPEQADSPAAVLAAAQAEQATAYRAEVRILELALDWAVMHEPDPTDDLGFESAVLIAGEGTPEVGEFCAHELAVALHISTDSGSSLIAEALELAYRLPRVWARVKAGDLPPWRARRIADRTICLPPEGADYVDRHVAPFAHRMGIGQVDRLVEEALVRFDPEKAEARRLAAADNRHVTLYTDQTDFDGTAHLDADLDLADALDLDAALSERAARLADLGCEDSLDVRRAHALGELARRTDPTLPLPGREVVLNVHVSDHAITSGDDTHLARVENTRSFVSVDQVRTWCGTPGTTITVRPVLDLNEHLSGAAYETPARLVELSALVDETCVFPWCTRPARRTDCDHVIPHAAGGTTCSCNIARLCRRHHRLKTHPGTTWCSSAAATCGPARTVTSSCGIARAHSTSPPPMPADGRSTRVTSGSSRTRSHHAPHPATGGVVGAISCAPRTPNRSPDIHDELSPPCTPSRDRSGRGTSEFDSRCAPGSWRFRPRSEP